MDEERDWIAEEKALTAIYIRRGYVKKIAEDMTEREMQKRKIECGYPIDTKEKESKGVGGKKRNES